MLFTIACAIFALGLCAILFIYFTSTTYAKVVMFDAEKFFIDPKSNEKHSFPSIDDRSSVLLSVIVPAYNEEQRCIYSFTAMEISSFNHYFIPFQYQPCWMNA